MYDYSKLRGRITEVFGSLTKFAEAMELSSRTVSLKINQSVCFKQTEIEKAVDILHLGREDIQPYFFTLKVQY